MRNWCLRTSAGICLAAALAVLATPRPANAFIHEIIAAMCRAGGEEVEPPGQASPDSKAFTKALLATGFIVGTEFVDNPPGTNDQFIIHLDPTIPNSKFRSTGGDVTIPNGSGPGVDLVLSPGVEPDPDFAAHAHCNNLR
jgi:hypothetical protein